MPHKFPACYCVRHALPAKICCCPVFGTENLHFWHGDFEKWHENQAIPARRFFHVPELRIFGTTPCHYCPILARQRKRLMPRIFQPVHEPRFLFGLNNHRYYHSDEDNSRVRIVTVLQGQKDLNPRHAVLEAMLKFLSRSDFSPILGICCQWQR